MAHSHDMRSWHYFLTLERDLAKTTSFVEPHPSNHHAFSDRYAGLLLLIGSEVDVTAKALCNKISPGSTPQNMRDCCNIIMGQYPDLHTVEIDVDQYGLMFKPWESWGKVPRTKPGWWDNYNAVKHDRLQSRDKASQRTVFDGICGLLILNLYFYGNDAFMFPRPELLNYGFPAFLVDSPEKALPGI